MTTKTRLAQLEKQKPQVKTTWKEFIESDGETWDAETKAAWAEFVATVDTSQNSRARLTERF